MDTTTLSALSQDLETLTERLTHRVAMVWADGATPRSALIVDRRLVVTAAMDARPGEEVRVRRTSGEDGRARVLRFWRRASLALLAVDGDDSDGDYAGDMAAARDAISGMATGSLPRLGALTVTVAWPSPEGAEVRTGVVRCVGSDGSYVQTDGAAYPGFAGAPVFDAAGNLLGITQPGAGGNDGTVMPVAALLELLENPATDTEHPVRAVLGVRTESIGRPGGGGRAAAVVDVEEGSGAEEGGVQYGDVIVAVDGMEISGPGDLHRALANREPGDSVAVRILRGGTEETRHVVLGAAAVESGTHRGGGHHGWRQWAMVHMMG